MVFRVSHYAKQLVTDERALRRELETPVLLWEAAPVAGASPSVTSWEVTGKNVKISRPEEGDPVIFELKKAVTKQNAFAMGVTVGRTENNDIAIDDASVSRFHGYFQQDPRTQVWRFVDADSSNGTSVGPLKLTPNSATELADNVRLRLGSVDLRFLTAEGFVAYLRKLLQD